MVGIVFVNIFAFIGSFFAFFICIVFIVLGGTSYIEKDKVKFFKRREKEFQQLLDNLNRSNFNPKGFNLEAGKYGAFVKITKSKFFIENFIRWAKCEWDRRKRYGSTK